MLWFLTFASLTIYSRSATWFRSIPIVFVRIGSSYNTTYYYSSSAWLLSLLFLAISMHRFSVRYVYYSLRKCLFRCHSYNDLLLLRTFYLHAVYGRSDKTNTILVSSRIAVINQLLNSTQVPYTFHGIIASTFFLFVLQVIWIARNNIIDFVIHCVQTS